MTESISKHDWLLFPHWFSRSIVYCLCSLGLAIGITFLSRPNFWTAFVIFFGTFSLCLIGLSTFGFFNRPHAKPQAVRRIHLVIIILAAPGLLWGAIGGTYFHIKRQTASEANRRPTPYQEPVKAPLSAHILKDWEKRFWKQAAPLCLEFTDEGIKSTCPIAVVLNYCWKMPSTQDWGTRHTDCDLGQGRWLVAQPGFTSYEARPWCRSYSETCVAEAVVNCAVATQSPKEAKQFCSSK